MSPSRPRVLIVDDDEPTRRLLARALSAYCDVITAEDGVEGVEAGLANLPNLIISDIQMPWLDGISMVRELRERGELVGVPVIFLTAGDDAATTVAAIQAGARKVMSKPIPLEELHEAVKRALSSTSGFRSFPTTRPPPEMERSDSRPPPPPGADLSHARPRP